MWNPFKNMGFFQLLKLLIQYGALIMAVIKVLEYAVEIILPEWDKIKNKEFKTVDNVKLLEQQETK